MRHKFIILCFLLISIVALVYALSMKPHHFTSGECSLCHFDEKNDPVNIKPDITNACGTCHSGMDAIQSHPVDMYPSFSLPEDMPLLQGKLTCVTCHYVHPDYVQRDLENEPEFAQKNYFLRRPVSGIAFCGSCHKIGEKHIVFENTHPSTYKVFDNSASIDRLSLTCIECHDSYLTSPGEKLGLGLWKHNNRKTNHPIGISYVKISKSKPKNFRPESMLSSEIKLFGGKIGCGTCHHIYARERFQLVMDNWGSRLCLECHIK